MDLVNLYDRRFMEWRRQIKARYREAQLFKERIRTIYRLLCTMGVLCVTGVAVGLAAALGAERRPHEEAPHMEAPRNRARAFVPGPHCEPKDGVQLSERCREHEDPISLSLIEESPCCVFGRCYEGETLAQWLETGMNTDPKSNLPLPPSTLADIRRKCLSR